MGTDQLPEILLAAFETAKRRLPRFAALPLQKAQHAAAVVAGLHAGAEKPVVTLGQPLGLRRAEVREVRDAEVRELRDAVLEGGILGVDMAPRFRSYVRERNVRSYDYDGRVAVGSTLPSSGVTYYDVPSEYRVQPGYRYTVVNDRPVLVARGHRIVEVID